MSDAEIEEELERLGLLSLQIVNKVLTQIDKRLDAQAEGLSMLELLEIIRATNIKTEV